MFGGDNRTTPLPGTLTSTTPTGNPFGSTLSSSSSSTFGTTPTVFGSSNSVNAPIGTSGFGMTTATTTPTLQTAPLGLFGGGFGTPFGNATTMNSTNDNSLTMAPTLFPSSSTISTVPSSGVVGGSSFVNSSIFGSATFSVTPTFPLSSNGNNISVPPVNPFDRGGPPTASALMFGSSTSVLHQTAEVSMKDDDGNDMDEVDGNHALNGVGIEVFNPNSSLNPTAQSFTPQANPYSSSMFGANAAMVNSISYDDEMGDTIVDPNSIPEIPMDRSSPNFTSSERVYEATGKKEAELALLKERLAEKKKRLVAMQKKKTPDNSPPNSPKPATKSERNISPKPNSDAVSLAERNAIRFASKVYTTRIHLPDDLDHTPVSNLNEDEAINVDHAKSLIGTCQFMCPDDELKRRENEGDIQLLETIHPDIHPPDWNLRHTTVKRFRRSAADYKLDIPDLVRPPDVLERVCSYLEEWIVERDRQGIDPRFSTIPAPLDVYLFIWDRTRMVRKDFILQNYVGTGGNCDARAVRCHERIARWHAACEHQLSHIPDFVKMQSQQNIAEMGQAMKTLNLFYDDSLQRSTLEDTRNKKNAYCHGCASNIVMGVNPVDFDGKVLRNDESEVRKRIIGNPGVSNGTAEPEMRALYILLTLENDGGMEVLKYAAKLSSERPEVFHSKPVQLALEIFKAKHELNYARFFSILRSPATPYLFACLMFKYVEEMRRVAIRMMHMTYGYKKKDADPIQDHYPLIALAKLLCFEDMDEARATCSHYNITTREVEVLSTTSPSGKKRVEIISWKASRFAIPKDKEKGVVIPLRPKKMIRTIERKANGATRLAICRGEVSGEGSALHFIPARLAPIVVATNIPSSEDHTVVQKENIDSIFTIDGNDMKENQKRKDAEELRRKLELIQKLEEKKTKQAEEYASLEQEKVRDQKKLQLEAVKRKEEELVRRRKEEEEKKDAADRSARKAEADALEAKRRLAQEEEERQRREEEKRLRAIEMIKEKEREIRLKEELEKERRRKEEREKEEERRCREEREKEEQQRMDELKEKRRLQLIEEENENRKLEEQKKHFLLLEEQRKREKEERRLRELEERRKRKLEEAKINAAKRLLLWRRLQRNMSKQLQMNQAEKSLRRIDPTFSSSKQKREISPMDFLDFNNSDYCEDAEKQLPLSDFLQALISENTISMQLEELLMDSLISLEEKNAYTLKLHAKTVHALTLGIAVLQFESVHAETSYELLHRWMDTRLHYNQNVQVESDFSLMRFLSLNVNLIHSTSIDFFLILVPPLASNSSFSNSLNEHCLAQISCDQPIFIINLDDGSDQSYNMCIEHLFSRFSMITVIDVKGDDVTDFEDALQAAMLQIMDAFVYQILEHHRERGKIRMQEAETLLVEGTQELADATRKYVELLEKARQISRNQSQIESLDMEEKMEINQFQSPEDNSELHGHDDNISLSLSQNSMIQPGSKRLFERPNEFPQKRSRTESDRELASRAFTEKLEAMLHGDYIVDTNVGESSLREILIQVPSIHESTTTLVPRIDWNHSLIAEKEKVE